MYFLVDGDDIRANSTFTCERTELKELLRTARKLLHVSLSFMQKLSKLKSLVLSCFFLGCTHLKWENPKVKSVGKFTEPFFFLVFFCLNLFLDCQDILENLYTTYESVLSFRYVHQLSLSYTNIDIRERKLCKN